jgi:hypothetical protein
MDSRARAEPPGRRRKGEPAGARRLAVCSSQVTSRQPVAIVRRYEHGQSDRLFEEWLGHHAEFDPMKTFQGEPRGKWLDCATLQMLDSVRGRRESLEERRMLGLRGSVMQLLL